MTKNEDKCFIAGVIIGVFIGILVGTISTFIVVSTVTKSKTTEVRPVVITVYPQKSQDVTKTVDELLKRRPILPTFDGVK